MKSRKTIRTDNPTKRGGTGSTRCAVAKIDLKGRFVYLDDLISDILGSSPEELFGRQLVDFVHEDCHQSLACVIEKRSLYESSFDSIQLSLLTPDGGIVKKTCVISLSFIAGNPVNFQLVFVNSSAAQPDELPEQGVPSEDDLVEQFLSCDFSADLSVAARDLADVCGAKMVLAYESDADSVLTLLNEDSSAFEPPPLTEWHLQIAAEGGQYECTSARDAQAAIEKLGSAPNEYVESFQRAGRPPILVRVVFEDETETAILKSSVARARVAAAVIPGLVALTGSTTENRTVPNSTTLAESVGMAGVGVLQTDSHGKITAYNSALAADCHRSILSGDVWEFLDGLRDGNRHDTINMLLAMTETALGSSTCIPEKVAIVLPSGARGEMIISVRPSDDQEQQLTAVFLPSGSEVMAGSRWKLAADFLDSSCRLVQPSMATAASLGEKLAHEFHSELGGNGRFYLQCLDQQMSRQKDILEEIQLITSELRREPAVEPCDLELIVHKLSDKLSRSHPHRKTSIESSVLDRLMTFRRPLSTILEGIAVACLAVAEADPVLKICARCDKKDIVLTVNTDCPQEQSQLRNLFESARPNDAESHSSAIKTASLAGLRSLARVLGGDLEATANKNGLSFTLRLPGRFSADRTSGIVGGAKG